MKQRGPADLYAKDLYIKDLYTKAALTVIVVLLALLLLHRVENPAPVQAQSDGRQFYIEPGYTLLRSPDGYSQVKGKMMVDLRTGKIWGFPTLVDGPYPVDPTDSKPPISKPMYLGKFDFSGIDRGQ